MFKLSKSPSFKLIRTFSQDSGEIKRRSYSTGEINLYFIKTFEHNRAEATAFAARLIWQNVLLALTKSLTAAITKDTRPPQKVVFMVT